MTLEGELSNSPRLFIDSAPSVQRVAPGEKAIYAITIENRSDEAQSQSIGVRGISPEWCAIDFDERRKAFPRERRSATLIVSVPPDAEPSQRPFLIVAQSGADQSGAQCTLDVLGTGPAAAEAAPVVTPEPVVAAPPPSPGVQLTPAAVTWDGDAATPSKVTVTVRNVGTEETEYTVAVDGLIAGWYTLPPKLRIPGGEAAEAQISIHPPARAKSGDFAFSVRVSVEDQPKIATESKASLTIPAPAAPVSRRPTAVPVTPQTPEPPPAQSSAPVLPPEVSMAPKTTFKFSQGEVSAQAILTIQNKSRLIERYEIRVEGIPEEWASLSTTELRLDPGASQQVPLRLTPRTGAGMPAGEYTFRVRVSPHRFPDSFAEVGGLIQIAGVASFDARLVPAQAEGRKEKFKLTLANTGSVPINFWMEGADSEGMCKYKFPAPPTIDPGEESIIPVYVGARRNGLLGQAETFDFRLKVAPAGGVSTQVRQFDARLIHRPFLGFRFAGIAIFLGALAAAVGIFISLGPSKVEGTFNWMGCQFDDDYQPVKGQPAYIKQKCGGAPEPTQKAALAGAGDATAQPTAVPGATQAPSGGGGCTPSPDAAIAVGGKVKSLTNAVRMRQAAGLSEAQVSGNPVLNTNDTAQVLEGPGCADNIVWWKVKKDNGGQEGWVAEGQNNQLFLQKQ